MSQTELSATFNDSLTNDAYPAGSPAPGLNRGEVVAVVDPASGTMTPAGEVHVVIAAGAYSVIGAVANADTGCDVLRTSILSASTGAINDQIPEHNHCAGSCCFISRIREDIGESRNWPRLFIRLRAVKMFG